MTYYSKCKNCAVDKNTCTRRSAIKSAISGLKITSIKFKCGDRKPLFHTGQRVSFVWRHYDDSARDIYGEVGEDKLLFCGTVSQEIENAGKFIVRVDDAPVKSSLDPDVSYLPKDVFRNGGFAVKVRPSEMRAIPEEDRKICRVCLGYDSKEMCMQSDYLRAPTIALCNNP